LNNIPKNLRELSLDINIAQMEMRNYINHPDKDVQTVRLKYQLDPAEFISYDVLENSCLIVSSHDFLSVVELAEASGNELRIIFTKNGKPLIASFEREDSIKVQMVISTMREETLKLLKQPAGATSYKALMGSYIEGRRSHGPGPERFELTDNLTESAMSPRIDSFESNPRSKVYLKPLTVQAKAKRKSFEMTTAPEEDPVIPTVITKTKKQKPNDTLTQEEQQEVSQMLVDIAAVDLEEDNDMLFNPTRNTSSLNMFAGLAERKIKVQPRPTVNESEVPIASTETFRFDLSKANLPSEDIQHTETMPDSIRALPDDIIRSSQKSLDLLKTKKSNYYAKKLFAGILKPKEKKNGKLLAPKTDSESDETFEDETFEEDEPIVID
jgi:hypothetical protein